MAFLQSISESFTEDEMKRIKEAKNDMTWREFIISSAELILSGKKVN